MVVAVTDRRGARTTVECAATGAVARIDFEATEQQRQQNGTADMAEICGPQRDLRVAGPQVACVRDHVALNVTVISSQRGDRQYLYGRAL